MAPTTAVMKPLHQGVALAAWIGLCLLAGVIGSLATGVGLDDWYRALEKPAWTPPNWVFAPVWTLLYVLMGVAAWLVWLRRDDPRWKPAIAMFLAQLALNVAWSAIFFAMQEPGWAAVELVILWLAILVTTALFWRIRPLAGALMIPYVLWVAYAGTLNIGIWWLN